jgi:NitT/TauT family transport system ATP-binding protein
MVFQDYALFPWLTVYDNIAFGLKIKCTGSVEIEQIVSRFAALVGLSQFIHHYPHQLSGGMRQRVSIARAFATNADLILMDEPFVSLDQPTRERMQQEVLDIWKNLKRTIVFVTHNLEEAVFLGDRVIILSEKPTSIKADLPIDLPRPRDSLSAEFTELRARCFSFLHQK